MKLKKLTKNQYEIKNNNDLIYISKEKNPHTKNLYLYFIDVFDITRITSMDSEPYNNEVFDELCEVLEYLENNFEVNKKILNKIKFK